MPRLKSDRMEKFCQIIAREDCAPSVACFRAGYGQPTHTNRDSYHAAQAERLLSKKEIVMRIEEIRDNISISEADTKEEMIDFLKRTLNNDPTKYMGVRQTEMEDGTMAQQVYIAVPKFADWKEEDRKLIDHFDPKTGNPVFISKKWAWEKLAKILGLVEDKAPKVDMEDIASLFIRAGLTNQQSQPAPCEADDFDDMDDNVELIEEATQIERETDEPQVDIDSMTCSEDENA